MVLFAAGDGRINEGAPPGELDNGAVGRHDYEALGEWCPSPLCAVSSKTATARLEAATQIARQLRRPQELLLEERLGDDPGLWRIAVDDALVEPLGERVIDANADEVLKLLADELRELRPLGRRLESWPDLRRAYSHLPARGARPARPVVTIGLCLAADVTFAPYAYGAAVAAAERQASLRIDLRAAARMIWTWGQDYPALGRSLRVAHSDGYERTIAFPPFVNFFRWLLQFHLQTDAAPEELTADVETAAGQLGAVATEQLAIAGAPGRAADRNMYSPIVSTAWEMQPGWFDDETDNDPEEAFAGGAAPLVFEALTGQREPASAIAALESLAAELKIATAETEHA